MEAWHYGGHACAAVCVNVRAGEGAEGMDRCPEEDPIQAHVPAGLHW